MKEKIFVAFCLSDRLSCLKHSLNRRIYVINAFVVSQFWAIIKTLYLNSAIRVIRKSNLCEIGTKIIQRFMKSKKDYFFGKCFQPSLAWNSSWTTPKVAKFLIHGIINYCCNGCRTAHDLVSWIKRADCLKSFLLYVPLFALQKDFSNLY